MQCLASIRRYTWRVWKDCAGVGGARASVSYPSWPMTTHPPGRCPEMRNNRDDAG